MSISGINSNNQLTIAALFAQQAQTTSSTGSSSTPTNGTQTQDSFTNDFASMLAAVQAGDMSGAQAALTQMTNDPSVAGLSYSPSSTSGSSSTASTSPLQNDLTSLVQAVQGGNLSAAQQALGSLQTDMQSDPTASTQTSAAQGGHHHHHHHHAQSSSSSSSSTSSTDSSTDPTSFFSTDSSSTSTTSTSTGSN